MLRTTADEAECKAKQEQIRALIQQAKEQRIERQRQQEEEAMAQYTACEPCDNGSARMAMAERIAARKRELAEKKATEEQEAMDKFMKEQMLEEQAKEKMLATIKATKERLAEKRAQEEAEKRD